MSKAKKTVARWHYVTKENRRVLRDPGGRDWYGTRAEVRDAALCPLSRDALAQSLRLNRKTYLSDGGDFDFRNYLVSAQWLRQDALWLEALSDRDPLTVSRDERILLAACARYMERTFEEFITESVCSVIKSVIEEALSDGLPELPLTRYERRAFRGRQSDYCQVLKFREAKGRRAVQ